MRAPLNARTRARIGGGLPGRQDGIALIMALWITIMLTVIASSFAFSMRNEALAARNAFSGAQALAAADGAIDREFYELLRPRNQPEIWTPDGTPHRWTDGEAAVTVVATDESAKIDLNSAREPLLKGLMQNVGGASEDEAEGIAEAILDWRDIDDLRRPHGAEEADYRAAGRNYKPSNGPFESVGELRRVLGVTPAIFDRVAGTLTVFSRQPGINPLTASREVLLAVPNVTPEQVDAYLAQRADALANKLPVPPFAPAQSVSGAPVQVWRIRAEVLMPDGVRFVREAVVRPSIDPRRPYITYLWQEGVQPPPPPAAADATPATDSNASSGSR